MSDLESDLKDIRGIGDAKAEEIIAVVEDYNGTDDELTENIKQAWDYYQDGQESYAGKFLRRAYEQVE